MSKTALILLAAGSSSRMGQPKQLMNFRGEPLLRHAATVALEAGCDPVVVVLGARADELQVALDGLPVKVAINEQWAQGMGTSIQAGLRQLDDPSIDAAILALADQPFITSAFLRGLGHVYREFHSPIVAARYAGTVGVPCLFGREAWQGLKGLAPDQGCKGLIVKAGESAILVDCPEATIDIDTPADYAAFVRDQAVSR